MRNPFFEHDFLPRTELTDTTSLDGKRVYDTPLGPFKSVTTIIGEKYDKTWLKQWRDRVGEAEADAILLQAGIRGTAIHDLAEKYVLNDPMWFKSAMPVNVFTFKKIAKVLDEGLDVVYGVEYPVYSGLLKTAGRSDLPARFRGVNTIVDFKSSRGKKTRDDIPHYFVQSTAYALMVEELTGVKFPQIAVIVAEDNEDDAKVFIERCRDWYPEVKRVFMS